MKTILIVGASRGLGRALAEEHLSLGWYVIATVRDPAALRDAPPGKLEVHTLDVTDWAGVDAFARTLKDRRLDVLFVNAGIADDKRPIGEVQPDVFTRLMLTNALAPLRQIDRLVHLVPREGTVAVMSSGLGSVAGNGTGGWEAYRMSKAALNTGLKSIAARRAAEGRTYIATAPGWVRTEMGGEEAALSIGQSIPRVTDMLEERAGRGGVAYVNYDGKDLPW